MRRYVCKVGTPEGAIAERTVVAASAAAARKALADEGFQVFSASPRGGAGNGAGAALADEPARAAGDTSEDDGGREGLLEGVFRRGPLRRRGRVPARDLLLFAQELAALVGAGLPLLRSLDILRTRRSGTPLGDVLDRVRERVAAGASLAGALEAETDEAGVPPLFVTNVEIGEASGELEQALRRYAAHLERAEALKGRVRGALVYPAVLFSVSLGVVAILMGVVVPRFTAFYENFDAELPFLTRILVGSAGWLQANLAWIALGLVAAAVALAVWKRSERGRERSAAWGLRVPMVGRLRRLYLDVETARTLGTLLRGGTPLVPAIRVTVRGTDNPAYRRRLLGVAEEVAHGTGLHRALEAYGILDDMGLEMVHVGESTGTLDEMLEHVASSYDEVLDRRLNTLVGLLEPAVLVTMGLFVAFVLLSLYLPLFRTVQLVG